METTPHPDGSPEQPAPVTVVQGVPVYVPPPKRSIFARIFYVFVWLVLLGSLLLNFLLFTVVGILGLGLVEGEGRVQEKFVSHQVQATDKVAILSIEGTIISSEGFIKQQIDHARKDIQAGRLKALVVRVNSPGGSITGCDYIYYHLCELVKDTHIPIVVSMGGIAASGGYYVSMAVGDNPDVIFAEPTTWTGSIGVMIPHYNLAGLMRVLGVQEDNVTSGYLKGMGSFARPMTEEERKIFQGLVDDGFARFKTVIKNGRPELKRNPELLDKLATGQIFTTEQALQNGLIDKIGFLEDAVDRAIALANLDKNNVKVIKYKPEPSLLSILMGVGEARQPNFDLAALLDMTAPRAYYLCTWLPPLTGKP